MDYSYTDTIQERVNQTIYNYTEHDNGTITREAAGWEWHHGQNTYLFDVGGFWTDYTYHSDGTVKDVEFTVQLEPNNATEILQAVEPFKECKNDGKYPQLGDCFNEHYYYNGSGVSNSTAADLSTQLDSVPIAVNGEVEKTTSVSDKPKNITAKVKLRNGTGDIGSMKLGEHSVTFTVSSQTDWANEGTFFNTTSDGVLKLVPGKEWDGFEDGDYTSDPAWMDELTDGTATVQQSTVRNGQYALEIETDGSGRHALNYDRGGANDVLDGDVYQMWVQTDSAGDENVFFSLSNTKGGYAGKDSVRVGLSSLGDIRIGTVDDSGSPIGSSTAYNSPSSDTWYQLELELRPSDSEADLRVYDTSGSSLGSATQSTSGATSLQHIVLINTDLNDGESSGFFDDASFSTASQYSSGNWTGNSNTLGSGTEQIDNVTVDVASLPSGSSLDLIVEGKDGSNVTQETDVVSIDQTGEHNYSTSVGEYENWRFSFNMTSGSTPEVNSFTVYSSEADDETPPSITIHSPENQTYSSSTLNLNVTADEAVDFWQKSVDGGPNETFQPNTTIDDLDEGTHQLQVYATDSAGNTAAEEVYFTVDIPPPDPGIHHPENETYTDDTLDLDVTDAQGTAATWQYSLDGGTNTTFSPNTTLEDLDDGQTHLQVYATNELGTTTSDDVFFTVDTSDSGSDPGTDPDPAFFAVNITGTNSPVNAGNLLEVTADVENTGDESGTQNVTLELDGEQVDATSGTLSSGQSTAVTLTYLTTDGDAGNRTATVSSDDDTDSTPVTINGTSDDDSGDGDADEDDSGTGSGGSGSSSSPGASPFTNISVSSVTDRVPVGSTVTGAVTAENPHSENVTVDVTAWGLRDGCDVIALVDENAWGDAVYELPAESEQMLEYTVNVSGPAADRFAAGDSVSCTYDVDVPQGEDTEFTVTAELVSPGVFPGLSISGMVGAASTRQIAAAVALILAVVTGLAWRRRV